MAAIRFITLLSIVTNVTTHASHLGEENTCHTDPSGHAYRGNLCKTWGNHTCRSWADPLAVAYNITAEQYPDAGLGDHNYCRNLPDLGAAPGCVTKNVDVFWQYCELGMFHPDCRKYSDDPQECYIEDGAEDYRGHANVTRSGIPCQKWSVQKPHPHPYTQEDYPNAGLGDHNYCRNPAPDRYYAWCYTTNLQQWEFCDIGLPSVTCV